MVAVVHATLRCGAFLRARVDLQQRGRGGVHDRVCLLGAYAGGGNVVDRMHEELAGLVGAVGAEEKPVSTERFDCASQCRDVAMADGVVPHASRRGAWRFGVLRVLRRVLVISPLEQHRERAAEVGVDNPHVRKSRWDPARDQLHSGDSVLDGRTDHPVQVDVADEWAAAGGSRWM